MRFALLLPLVMTPLLAVTLAAVVDPAAWAAWGEAPRLLSLGANTLGLAAIAAAVAVPAGMLAAFVLERVRGAGVLWPAVIAALFVPLPVTAVAWQIVLGLGTGEAAWRPWAQGLLPAGIVHGFAALPWVIAIVGVGLRTSDRGLEEDALVLGGPRLAIHRVLMPRMMLAALAALGWVLVQTATEIPVTDAMMVRTFAEEVYTQIVGGTGVRGAVAIALPPFVILAAFAILAVRRIARRFPLNLEPTTTSRPLRLSKFTRYGLIGFVVAILVIVVAVPLGALMWKASGGGMVTSPSAGFAMDQIVKAVRLNGLVLAQSLAAAALTGLVTAWLATMLAWQARESRVKSLLLLLTAVLLAVAPGPVLGQGLKDTISLLLDGEEWLLVGITAQYLPLRALLYDQPSPLPTMLAGMLRLLPLALLIVAPVMRAIPRDLLDLARLDGADAWRTMGRPHMKRATAIAAVAVAGLVLGEVSAGKLVAPPGYRMFILDLFDQMHYGAEPTVAALALVQIAASTLLVLAGWLAIKLASRTESVH